MRTSPVATESRWDSWGSGPDFTASVGAGAVTSASDEWYAETKWHGPYAQGRGCGPLRRSNWLAAAPKGAWRGAWLTGGGPGCRGGWGGFGQAALSISTTRAKATMEWCRFAI